VHGAAQPTLKALRRDDARQGREQNGGPENQESESHLFLPRVVNETRF
jgi:hypothetical protein